MFVNKLLSEVVRSCVLDCGLLTVYQDRSSSNLIYRSSPFFFSSNDHVNGDSGARKEERRQAATGDTPRVVRDDCDDMSFS